MRKFICVFFVLGLCSLDAHAYDLSRDTADPLFLQGKTGLLSKTHLSYFETGLRLGQYLSYGFSDRFALSASLHYQQDFDGPQDGLSSVDLGGTYRLVTQSESENRIVYDVLFGLKLGGSHRVRTPDYADSTYYIGLRLGRQYEGMTLAATIKSSWIFDDVPLGMAFIDFNPEAYFRIAPDWRIGVNFGLRKATNPHYDEESVGGKLVRQYGRTQYVGYINYEFEQEEVNCGVRVNILF